MTLSDGALLFSKFLTPIVEPLVDFDVLKAYKRRHLLQFLGRRILVFAKLGFQKYSLLLGDAMLSDALLTSFPSVTHAHPNLDSLPLWLR